MTHPTDFRALCSEMCRIWSRSTNPDDLYENLPPLIDRARAALSAAPQQPSDRELDGFIHHWWEQYGKGYLPNASDRALVIAALARYGGQAAPVPAAPQQPSDEEMERLFDAHRSSYGYDGWALDWEGFKAAMQEAYASHGAQAAPVPVAERPWERDGWCDEQGRCWWWRSDGVDEFWEFICLPYPVEHIAKLPKHITYGPCLPHYALPLPGAKP